VSGVFTGSGAIDAWLQPLDGDGGACGPDLEYDNDFHTLTLAAAGKPETQFEPATPPDWRSVRMQCEALMDRTRDLRVAVHWVRACTNLEGFVAVPEGLRLLHGLLDNFWETLHPLPDPDDGDPYARMNALGLLRETEGLVGDLRRAALFSQRGIGEVRVRSIEVALGLLTAKEGEPTYTRDQLGQMLSAAVAADAALSALPAEAMAHVKALASLLNDRAGTEAAPDLKPLQSLIHTVVGVMPSPQEAPAAGDDGGSDEPADGDAAGSAAVGGAARASRGLSGTVATRDDALRAIDMVCEFLERTEPTSPAPLLLRRARRMINRNFLQLMKELAPDALAEVARVMGVDPDSVQLDDESA
jgi:type VI secretion system protein ImpA